ncbi:sulfite exporter TauE/SafE family protein [Natronospira bacteriovora]|uniref:Probable membrane transporter protein n=1 Tax=Natronospira bacteriovora TaxID=3069753 RepID=A0ABU0W892_9GAMM|nr:sulfite exporter TauE/SafE family protein [Natronospira sp. AB-CW4]MDQ2070252.1 sulfite exporter TauE/SafE family protein [Natronospira sp. AB-CW4]
MAFPLSGSEWLLASFIVFVGALIQGSIGFGVALLGAPLLFLIHPQLVPAPVIIIGMSLPALILARDWRAVAPRDVGWVLPGMAAGSGLAGLLLGVISEEALGLLFGSLVLMGVALSIGIRLPLPGPRLLLSAGTAAGFMATSTSIGGPPLALAFQTVHGQRLRGTLSACFLPGGVFSLLALAWAGRFGWVEVWLGLSLFPAITAGFLLSGRVNRFLDQGWLRPALLTVSALAAVMAIVRALL